MPAIVYHRKDPDFKSEWARFPDDYEPVARVKTKKLDEAFELTNSINCPWWENDGVSAIKQTRSTSVGDVVEVDGVRYLCADIGWEKENGSA